MAPSTTATTTTTTDNKVWLITGCSSGFGREIAIAARNRGDLVIATARKVETLDELKTLGCEALALDVTASDEAVKEVVAKANALYGRIDVLVNNAGYTANGAVEEASAKEIQDLFETNVFGLLRVTRAVLPYMREKKSGTIANIGSVSGHITLPLTGIYSATKFAVAGLTQTLREEVAPFGIDVTVIEPDLFRTSVLSSMRRFEKPIDDYQAMTQAVLSFFMSGDVPMGDATKGAQAIVEALTKTGRAEGRVLPHRLLLGMTVREAVEGVLTRTQQQLNEWSDFAEPSAFAESK
ncbi:hypothetical protein Poli38472_007511 [Pythium oligandrum]|uniref:Uncharacterized protein n=1 Tax=Pythium oligandrum TaxID=41045 RepID=A0A8K1CQN0_PYTOL|nr:hypothetical protein Poli38472_007511 [Pythium oligandrum]|eukprot:TMW67839.1 hypothetical protein Poli38472_007511 [Pythium oligandrum]